MVELLAPAGSPEAVTAAVQSGADAVYLSFEDLTGCRRTENIPNSEFESVIRYCRIRGCRAYLALNIPVREDELNNDVVNVGSTVTVFNETRGKQQTYSLVGSSEADPFKGKISQDSPIGAALVGRHVGETVQVTVPAGVHTLRIESISRS